jgi:hypothetical protein
MRKLLLPAVAIASLIIACENKAPTGPGGVGPGGVTVSLTTTTTTTSTTTTVPATSTISTTTTSVTGTLSRRYVTAGGAPNVPSDMQLLFQLLTGTLAPTSLLERLPIVGEAFATATEVRYKVTGTYVMPNGTTGTVNGDLFGPSDPIQNGGEFHGVLTATVGSCTAERIFRGPMGPFSLNLGGADTISDCAGSPLSFNALVMTQSNAPPPPGTSTTTSVPVSSTTTTSVPACTLTVSPTTVQAADTQSTQSVTVTASATTCTWTAQSQSPWVTVLTGSGSGSGPAQFTVAANSNGPARTGSLLVAGQLVTVNQSAAPAADLIPTFDPQLEGFCTSINDGQQAAIKIRTLNQGQGASVASSTRLILTLRNEAVSHDVPILAAKGQDDWTFSLPDSCFVTDGSSRSCSFAAITDANDVVFEGTAGGEGNNSVGGVCREFFEGINKTRKVVTIFNKR